MMTSVPFGAGVSSLRIYRHSPRSRKERPAFLPGGVPVDVRPLPPDLAPWPDLASGTAMERCIALGADAQSGRA